MHMRGDPGDDERPRRLCRHRPRGGAPNSPPASPRPNRPASRPEAIAIDPGIGFAKLAPHSLELLRRLPELAGLGRPILVGVSRKSFIGRVGDEPDPQRRLPGSLAAGLFARVARRAHPAGARRGRNRAGPQALDSAGLPGCDCCFPAAALPRYIGPDLRATETGMTKPRRLFGTDGIRGKANTDPMTAGIALRLGQAAGLLFTRGNHRHRVVIGKDTRLSGYMIEPALTAGFIGAGMDVTLLGPLPTPAVAMLTRSLRADLGVMISASHNPFEDNGIKLFGPDGTKLSDDDRGRDRGADGQRASPLASPRRPRWAAPRGWRTPPAAISRPPRPASRAACGWTT